MSGIKSDWFGSDKDMVTTGLSTSGMACQGRYCAEGQLTLLGVKVDKTQLQYSGWISDNQGRRWPWNEATDDVSAECPKGLVITRIACRGKFCDDLRLECAPPISWEVDPLGLPWVGETWFSEESPSRQECPTGFAMVGLECEKSVVLCLTNCKSYCDNKKIQCRQIIPKAAGSLNMGIAESKEIDAAQAPSIACDSTCRVNQQNLMAIAGGAFSPSASFALSLTMLLWFA